MFRLRFWQDHWCVNAPFCTFFPDIFEIARDKDVIVAGAWSRWGAGGYWDILFLRSFNDWEVDSVACLLNFIQNFVVSTEREKVRWKTIGGGGSSEGFSVREAFFSVESWIRRAISN